MSFGLIRGILLSVYVLALHFRSSVLLTEPCMRVGVEFQAAIPEMVMSLGKVLVPCFRNGEWELVILGKVRGVENGNCGCGNGEWELWSW